MVLPHRPVGFADGAAPIPVYGWDLIKSLKPNHAGRVRDKVAAGLNPAAQATPERLEIRGTRQVGTPTLRGYDWLPL